MPLFTFIADRDERNYILARDASEKISNLLAKLDRLSTKEVERKLEDVLKNINQIETSLGI